MDASFLKSNQGNTLREFPDAKNVKRGENKETPSGCPTMPKNVANIRKGGDLVSNKIIIGIALGDQAGISSEIVAKALLKGHEEFTPVIFGNYDLFCKNSSCPIDVQCLDTFTRETLSNHIYFIDISAGDNIETGKITADSGKLIYDSLKTAIEFQKNNLIDAIIMAPITKQALHDAGLKYTSEFEMFQDMYQTSGCRAVIRCENIFRATVIGHCAFREIADNLTTEKIVQTAEALYSVISTFKPEKKCTLAIAALNPHAGENGLFGDEEARIISPAIDTLNERGISSSGPWPADTVFLRSVDGRDDGVVFLYHDQGNIAMKSKFFGDGVLIYTNIPAIICSVGHGSALDIAGKGIANEQNMKSCIDTAVQICHKRRAAQ